MKKAIYILLSILLSACAATTPAPSATPKAMDTLAPEASSTPTVAVTPTVQPPTTTPKPAETIEIDLTEEARNVLATKVSKFAITCDTSIQATTVSPNGTWLAINCIQQMKPTLEIVNQEGQRWILNLNDYIAKKYINENGITGPGALHIEHWSKDEEYLYFSSELYFSGGGTCFYGFRAQGLYRIKLNDGTVSAILPANERLGYAFSFSSTKRRLAYIGRENLIILDLQTGIETNIGIGNQSAGNLIWSPDGSELAYATCEATKDDGNNFSIKKSTIKIFSVQKQTSRTILETEKIMLFIENWQSTNIMEIRQSPYGLMDDGPLQTIDPTNGQWIKSTLTPTPKP